MGFVGVITMSFLTDTINSIKSGVKAFLPKDFGLDDVKSFVQEIPENINKVAEATPAVSFIPAENFSVKDLQKGLQKVVQTILPPPESPEEARRMGLLNVGTPENPKYLDPFGFVGGMRIVGGAKAAIPNLSRIKAVQDVKNVLVDTANKFRGSIDEARRGVITHTMTKELADGLGMTTDKLLKRRVGQAFNAEEITAARQLLVSSADEVSKLAKQANKTGADKDLFNFRQALNRHSAIQQEVSGATAEAGRALSAFKIQVSPGQTQTDFYKKALEALGGKDVSEEMAKKISAIDTTDFVSMNRFLGQITKSTTADKVYEYWVNSILSNPKTHIVNTLSNALTRLAKIPERGVATTLDFLNSKITGKPRERFFGEITSDIIGMTEGFKEGTKKALMAWKTGLGSEGISKLEAPQQAIKGKLGDIARIPGRALTAEDEFFKALNSQSELYAQAFRKAAKEGLTGKARASRMADLIMNPLPEMLDAAKAEARYRTFQTELGKAGKALTNVRNKVPGLKYIMPFMRTPINIAKFGLEMTPLNFLRLGYLKSQGAFKGANFTDELAKPVMGSVLAGTLAYFAGQGKVTGHAPLDKEERDAFYREGKLPYAVKIGNKWYSYQRLEPFASLLGMTADFVNDMDEIKDEEKSGVVRAITSSLTQNLVNKTYMSGLSNLFNAIDDPVRYGGDWVELMASGFIPQASTVPTTIVDPYLRRPGNVLEAWQKKIPGLSKNVVPVRNIWGEKAQDEGSALFRAFSPIKQSTAREDAVDKELKKIGYEAGFPDKTIFGFKLDDKQYDIYQRTTGKKAKELLNQLVANPEFQKQSDEQKKKSVRDIVDTVRQRFRVEMGFMLFLDQMDIDLPKGVNQQTAAQVFYSLTTEPKFKEVSNEKKRDYYVRNLEKYLTQ